MKITELETNQGSVEIEGTIKELEEIKIMNKYGKELKLRNAVFTDDSGSVKLTLWNEDAEKFQIGDKVKITNGYVNEFQGEKQLTAGKFGKIEKAGEGDASIESDSSTSMEEPESAEGLEHTSGPTHDEEKFALEEKSEHSTEPAPESTEEQVAEEQVDDAIDDGTI